MACCCSDDDGVFVQHCHVGRLRVDNTPACPRFGRLEVSVIGSFRWLYGIAVRHNHAPEEGLHFRLAFPDLMMSYSQHYAHLAQREK